MDNIKLSFMKKFTFHILLFILIVLPINASAFDVSTITPKEMRITTVKEIFDIEEIPDDLIEALKNYHNTQKYSFTLNEFFQSPNTYLNSRIEALKKLQKAAPSESRFDFLHKQIECKLAYLNALPEMDDKHTTRMELKYRRMADHGVEMCEAYCFEFLDPLHRIGPEVKVYIDTWLCTDIPNYFIFFRNCRV